MFNKIGFVFIGDVEYVFVKFGFYIDVFNLNDLWFVVVEDSFGDRLFLVFGYYC